MNDRIDPLDAVKAVLGFPGYETAQEMTRVELLGRACDILTDAANEIRAREFNHDYRVHPYGRLLELADQIIADSEPHDSGRKDESNG